MAMANSVEGRYPFLDHRIIEFCSNIPTKYINIANWRHMKKIKVLSVRQPWAWCIFHAGKYVENRTWKTNYRGELYIHASKQFDYPAYSSLLPDYDIPQNLKVFEQGGIIGKIHLICCIKNSISSWAEKGMYHWMLASPEAVVFKPCKGQLRIFDLEVNWI